MKIYCLPVWEPPEPGSAAQILFFSHLCQNPIWLVLNLFLKNSWFDFLWSLLGGWSQFIHNFASFCFRFCKKKFPLIRRGGLNWVWVLIASECVCFVIFGSLAQSSSFPFDWFLDYIRTILRLGIFVFLLIRLTFLILPYICLVSVEVCYWAIRAI